jgi:hypothetical protein
MTWIGFSRFRQLITTGVVLLGLFGGLLLAGCSDMPKTDADTLGPELVVNGGFEEGIDGWRTNRSYISLTTTSPGHSGAWAALITTRAGTTSVLNDQVSTVSSAVAGDAYQLSAWVRTNRERLKGQLRIREVFDGNVLTFTQDFVLTDTSWQFVKISFVASTSGAEFDLNVLGFDVASDQELIVDDVSLRKVQGGRVDRSPPVPRDWKLSNGAPLSSRGVPSRGALFGAAVGSNTDPTDFEQEIGQRLGVRRTYWTAAQVNSAVDTARVDLANGRLPWISFKLPHSWDRMAAGDGDAWARGLASRLAELPGPVWVAFHHEPEGDGVIGDWTAMQERLGPIVREAAPNVGFTVILTGWNQLYGDSQYSLANVWPATTVDVAGFDIYNLYDAAPSGELRRESTDLRKAYFKPLSKWAESRGVAWALAESGFTDLASAKYPTWLEDTYDDLVATGGVAFTYFNTPLNSTGSWVITSSTKTAQFSRAIKRTPMFPELAQ